ERHGEVLFERWTRAWAPFGVGGHANPMTYDEAKGYSDQGWSRWTPVAGALQSLQEQSSTSQSSAPPQGQENANCAIHNLQLNLHSYSGDWILGWRRLAGEHSVEVHAKGKGLSDVWAHLEIRMTNSGLRSNAYISELIGMERKLIFLRVRAKGNGCNGGFTPWEHIQTRY
ncbi:MAG: hypothetical protein OXF90_13575, partial [Chloroflexi bacterium]|nr:hypothetical protein [Chloroflexota bacterium]